jgi:aminotransferase
MGDSYFEALRAAYTERREVLYDALTAIGFQCAKPEGSYYIMADIRPLTDKDDVGFSRFLVEEVGVAVVPGSSFFADPADGRFFVRFAFPKRMETLREATKRLEKVAE